VRTGETTTEIYNEDGRIAERVVRSGGSFRRELFKYDGELIEEKRIRSANVDRLFRYRYGEEEELNLVEIYERGELSKQIRYLSGDRRVETVFRKGEAIYRTEYRGEEMLSREQVE
jgi:hypothetical protein